jgi:uncharacterized protein YjbI with pentapeptide repeats
MIYPLIIILIASKYINNSTFTNVTFRDCVFINTNFNDCNFIDTQFIGTTFVNTHFTPLLGVYVTVIIFKEYGNNTLQTSDSIQLVNSYNPIDISLTRHLHFTRFTITEEDVKKIKEKLNIDSIVEVNFNVLTFENNYNTIKRNEDYTIVKKMDILEKDPENVDNTLSSNKHIYETNKTLFRDLDKIPKFIFYKLIPENLSNLSLTIFDNNNTSDYNNKTFNKCLIPNQNINNSSFTMSVFKDCLFHNLTFTECDFRFTIFVGCTFINTHFTSLINSYLLNIIKRTHGNNTLPEELPLNNGTKIGVSEIEFEWLGNDGSIKNDRRPEWLGSGSWFGFALEPSLQRIPIKMPRFRIQYPNKFVIDTEQFSSLFLDVLGLNQISELNKWSFDWQVIPFGANNSWWPLQPPVPSRITSEAGVLYTFTTESTLTTEPEPEAEPETEPEPEAEPTTSLVFHPDMSDEWFKIENIRQRGGVNNWRSLWYSSGTITVYPPMIEFLTNFKSN